MDDEVPIKRCTIHEELQPPAYRKEVINMMKKAAKGQKEKYPQHTGLKYYPFQK
jgi:small subunit ribosomal protein S6